MTKFTVGTFNVRNNPPMPQEHVEADVALGAKHASVIGWQEIHPDRYVAAVKGLPCRFNTYFPDVAGTPVSWDTEVWTLLKARTKKFMPGRERVMKPKPLVIVELRHNTTGQVVAFTNKHYVNAAWNDKPMPTKAWRKMVWRAGNVIERAVTRAYVRAGTPVVGLGDYNNRNARFLNLGSRVARQKVKYAVPGSSIDMILAVAPEGQQFTVRRQRTIDGHSDHALRVATLKIESIGRKGC